MAQMTYRQALHDTLREELLRDENVFLLGGDYTVPFGQAKVSKEGKDLTVISYSRMAAVALDVARRMEQENGLSIEVVDVRSLRPLDKETLVNSVKKTNRAIVFEEDWRSFGVGAEIAATVQEEAFDAQTLRAR
jgi:pyruvate dehydrogenase E1 component beta subunit